MASLSRSYYHSHRRATPFLGRSMGQHLYLIAEQNPDKEMYVFYADKERKTFKQMKEESQSLAASFLSLGLNTGDRIGVWGGNHFEWLVTYCACMQLGIVLVHIRMDFPLTTQKELLKKIGCKALVLTRTPESVYDSVCEIIPELRSCEPDKLKCEALPDMKFVVIGGQKHKGKSGTLHLDDLILQGSTSNNRNNVAEICLKINMDAPQIIIFTSGSTGFPKAVTHPSHSLLNFMHGDSHYRGDVADYKQPWETKFALIMNLAGVGAQMGALLPLARGCTTVVVSPAYDKDVLAKALHDEKCTDSFMLIHHVNDLLELPYLNTLDFSSMQIIIAGGSIISGALREEPTQLPK
ncbi:medium-chain acyl-CoA ligase ACSF2, mitochondrial-like [Amphiura filiformis]|uniref:medium-chain acyl-CoA ligase ACSF2, mitochondrial-like n=1 Tax=Amphiura filiformis TaxID=82378 RepID=UPI003B2181D0